MLISKIMPIKRYKNFNVINQVPSEKSVIADS